ncbi:MAG: hypothetical protein JSS32_07815 [Verrucomicrobia bacterium]|nr:hypothetical protein [Verrucomicrobiota bacterium]
MSKVGEGLGPQEANQQIYHKDIEKSAVKFDEALTGYQLADPEEKARLRAFMDDQLNVINAAVREIKRGGLYKQNVKVENDYKQFIETESSESYSALKHDIQTLREYNNLP